MTKNNLQPLKQSISAKNNTNILKAALQPCHLVNYDIFINTKIKPITYLIIVVPIIFIFFGFNVKNGDWLVIPIYILPDSLNYSYIP